METFKFIESKIADNLLVKLKYITNEDEHYHIFIFPLRNDRSMVFIMREFAEPENFKYDTHILINNNKLKYFYNEYIKPFDMNTKILKCVARLPDHNFNIRFENEIDFIDNLNLKNNKIFMDECTALNYMVIH